MRMIVALFCLAAAFPMAQAGVDAQVSGTVTIQDSSKKSLVPGGVLFVFAKKAGSQAGNGAPPVAVLRIPDPQFPVQFKLTAANMMMPGGSFEGPFSIYARYSPSGDAMDKSGPQGSDQKKSGIKVGESKVKIELKGK